MKKGFITLFLALSLISCGEAEKKEVTNEKPVVKIGATLPLSGDTAVFGNMAKDAMIMALDKWKQQNTKYKYEIVFADDQIKTQQAALNANRFISIEKVKAIISIWGTVDRVIDEISNKSNVISMSCTLGKNELPPLGVCNEVTNEDYASLLLNKLKKENIQRVALIVLNANGNVNLGNHIQDYLSKNGITITDYIKTNANEKDYRLLIKKAEQKNPEYYIMQMGNPGMDIFVRQFMELKPQGKLTSIWNFAELNPDVTPLIEDLWFIKGGGGTEKFTTEFLQKTGNEPNSCAANSYDNVDMLIWAYENTLLKQGEILPNNEDVINTLKRIRQRQGAVGIYDVDDKGMVRNKPILQKYHAGKFITIKD